MPTKRLVLLLLAVELFLSTSSRLGVGREVASARGGVARNASVVNATAASAATHGHQARHILVKMRERASRIFQPTQEDFQRDGFAMYIDWLLSFGVYLVLFFIFVYFYKSHAMTKRPEQFELKSDSVPLEALSMSFWTALLIFFGCDMLWHVLGCIVPMVVVGVIKRQELRAKFQMQSNDCETLCLDTLAWVFCGCCAIVQEARHVEDAWSKCRPALAAATELPPEFVCPLSRQLMLDPVHMPGDSKEYDRAPLQKWLVQHMTNPDTKEQLKTMPILTANEPLCKQVQAFLEEHPYLAPDR